MANDQRSFFQRILDAADSIPVSHKPTVNNVLDVVGALIAYAEHGDKVFQAAEQGIEDVAHLLSPTSKDATAPGGPAPATSSPAAAAEPTTPPAEPTSPALTPAAPSVADLEAQVAQLQQELATARAQDTRTTTSVEPTAPDATTPPPAAPATAPPPPAADVTPAGPPPPSEPEPAP